MSELFLTQIDKEEPISDGVRLIKKIKIVIKRLGSIFKRLHKVF